MAAAPRTHMRQGMAQYMQGSKYVNIEIATQFAVG